MSGLLLSVMAVIAIPDAPHFFRAIGPGLAVVAFLFVWHRIEWVVNRLFPDWAWQKKLGWLNFSAIRRADAFMQWLGYFVYVLLAAALVGILWVAEGFPTYEDWSDPPVLAILLVRVPVLVVCLGFWLLYLLGELIPKMSNQYEEEELEKFRAEQKEIERQEKMNPKLPGREPFRIEITPSRSKPKR